MRGRPRTRVWVLCPRGYWRECDGMEELFLELGIGKRERGLVRDALRAGDPFVHPRTNMIFRLSPEQPSGLVQPLRQHEPTRVGPYPLMRNPVTSGLGHREP